MTAVSAQTEPARVPLENYLQGHATGRGEFHEKAFLPEARLLFVRDGKLAERTSADYIKGASGKPADDKAKRRRSIEFVEVTGNAAIAKIVLDYPGIYFADYFALLKTGGEWKIVNKSFHAVPRTNGEPRKIENKLSDEEKRSISVPLENYVKAHATGNAEFVRRAFFLEAKVMFFANDKFNQWTIDEFATRFTGKPAADEAQRKRSFEIVDATGNAALARVVLDYPTVKFTDYMTLLKTGGEWKIINKTFYAEPKSPPKK